jgi:hypothetical protein
MNFLNKKDQISILIFKVQKMKIITAYEVLYYLFGSFS